MAFAVPAQHRRAVMMAAAGLGGIILLVIVQALMTPSEDGFEELRSMGAVESPGTTVSPPAPAGSPETGIDRSRLRDPFCPVVPVGAPGSAPAVCASPAPPPGSQPVVLVDVFAEAGVRLARVQVGRLTFPNLHEGDSFATVLRVASLSERCGEFLLGDQRFALCEGETTFKAVPADR
jgi:hypothetical protein